MPVKISVTQTLKELCLDTVAKNIGSVEWAPHFVGNLLENDRFLSTTPFDQLRKTAGSF